MTIFKYLARVVFIVAGVLLLMVINDLINPYKPIEVKIEPHMFIYPEDDILNPENHEAVVEVIFNMSADPWDMETDELLNEIEKQFNDRYLTDK